MELTAILDAPCAAAVLFPHVEDLAGYPAWMPLVHRAQRSGDGTWEVELRARVGPLARSKRLRMIRSRHDPPSAMQRPEPTAIPDQMPRPAPAAVLFERDEADGRCHGAWVLGATIEPTSAGTCRLTMRLHYGGALWTGGVLERVLSDQIEAGKRNLLALVTATNPTATSP